MPFLRIFGYFTLTLIVILFSNVSNAKIVKWVDDKGITHYGDQLPTQYVGQSNSEINKRGIVVKQNKPIDTSASQVNQEKIEQEKKDKALLASYTITQEIDLARDRNLQLDLATMQNLTQLRSVIETQGALIKKNSASFIKQNKPLPEHLATELNKYNSDLVNIDIQIANRKASMDQTKQRYAAEKARFIVLKPGPDGVANTTGTATNNPVTPANLPVTKVPTTNTKPSNTK